MPIKKSRPPNFSKIVDVFPMARGPTVIFAYAPHIYVPGGGILSQALLAHEGIHIQRQQLIGVEAWWDRYLVDPQFRWDEELLAHRREYQVMRNMARTEKAQQMALKEVGRKLASPLYGRMVSTEQAMKYLKP